MQEPDRTSAVGLYRLSTVEIAAGRVQRGTEIEAQGDGIAKEARRERKEQEHKLVCGERAGYRDEGDQPHRAGVQYQDELVQK